MNPSKIRERLEASFRDHTGVDARASGDVVQIALPAFLRDGDAAQIFVLAQAGEAGLVVTDLGQTALRLSYVRTITATVEDQMVELAKRHGFAFVAGQLRKLVRNGDLFQVALELAQLQTEIEALVDVRRRREVGVERFKTIAAELLEQAFPKHVKFNFTPSGTHDDELDGPPEPEDLFRIDAFVPANGTRAGGGRDLAVAFVAGDAEAERAVATRLFLEDRMAAEPAWVALPRNLDQLAKRSRERLLSYYAHPIDRITPTIDAPTAVEKLRELQGGDE